MVVGVVIVLIMTTPSWQNNNEELLSILLQAGVPCEARALALGDMVSMDSFSVGVVMVVRGDVLLFFNFFL